MSIDVTVSGLNTVVDVTMGMSNIPIDVDIGEFVIIDDHATYDGSYEVTPRVYAQSLDTDGKLMSDDVTVHEIPVTSTSNLQGGLTVLIG